MCRDHPELTTGGSVSNHHYGRGMDIAAIDGEPVNAGNVEAREVASELGSLDPSVQPDEIGTPWQIADPRYFHDADHNDHIHVAFKQAIDASWKPPADIAAGGAGAVSAAGTANAAGTAGVAGGGVASGTLELAAAARAAPSGGDTLSVRIPAEPPRSPSVARAGAGAADLVKPSDVDGVGGPKAMAALKEALKYKGTPYQWGGSTPKTGFDCSGLVQWAYAQQGVQIPRVTDQQILASNGTEVKRGELRAGDLVFFRNASGYVHHVGISMGGDKFLHAPHTGDVVKESSLSEPYYAQEFAGGRRFDKGAPDAVAAPDPAAVDAARAAHARDAVQARTPGTLTFQALSKQEASNHASTLQFMRAVRPEEAPGFRRAGAADPLEPGGPTGPLDYPGDDAPKSEIAAWMGRKAKEAGLPRELPVMAALVESGLTNIQGGDRDSVGFFQMRLGIWNKGKYAGYPDNPDLQLKWFIDTAVAVKEQRLARGEKGFLTDTSKWGLWIADVERPQENLRFKYQLQFDRARELLSGRS
jgi:cell wall-associated NlpC family hydrolase